MKEYKPDGSSSWHGWQNNPVRARPPCPLRRVALSMRPTRPALVSHVRAVVGGGAVRLHLVRSRAAVLGYVPDSRGSVAHHQFGLGAPQSCTLRFPVQSPGKVHRLALPADNNLVVNHSSSARSLCGLFVPIIHAGLPFVPFHAVLLCFLPAPTQPTLAHVCAQADFCRARLRLTTPLENHSTSSRHPGNNRARNENPVPKRPEPEPARPTRA